MISKFYNKKNETNKKMLRERERERERGNIDIEEQHGLSSYGMMTLNKGKVIDWKIL